MKCVHRIGCCSLSTYSVWSGKAYASFVFTVQQQTVTSVYFLMHHHFKTLSEIIRNMQMRHVRQGRLQFNLLRLARSRVDNKHNRSLKKSIVFSDLLS